MLCAKACCVWLVTLDYACCCIRSVVEGANDLPALDDDLRSQESLSLLLRKCEVTLLYCSLQYFTQSPPSSIAQASRSISRHRWAQVLT